MAMLRWDKDIIDAVQNGVSSLTVSTIKSTNRIKYVEQIELLYPIFLHFMYRAATHVNRPQAGFAELAWAMKKSAAPLELSYLLYLNRLIIYS